MRPCVAVVARPFIRWDAGRQSPHHKPIVNAFSVQVAGVDFPNLCIGKFFWEVKDKVLEKQRVFGRVLTMPEPDKAPFPIDALAGGKAIVTSNLWVYGLECLEHTPRRTLVMVSL